MEGVVIRAARRDDAAAIAGVHVRAWLSAYRGMLDDEILDAQSVAERERLWVDVLGRPTVRGLPLTRVAVRGQRLLGFCSALALDDDADATIGGLYLEPGHLRGGIGSALLAAVLGELARADLTDVALWVLADNRGAIAFYERLGFVDDGSRNLYRGAPELRMRASLASSVSISPNPTQEL
ncbi:MAG TPA: GNAT family N-acetyltransferase [Solirubrobacteraceae bacterium]|nr:GNAT family N-acetyltransferase [Solirubrobacteraceae bacterium]